MKLYVYCRCSRRRRRRCRWFDVWLLPFAIDCYQMIRVEHGKLPYRINEQFHLLDIISWQISKKCKRFFGQTPTLFFRNKNFLFGMNGPKWGFLVVHTMCTGKYSKTLSNFHQNPVGKRHRVTEMSIKKNESDVNSICRKYSSRNSASAFVLPNIYIFLIFWFHFSHLARFGVVVFFIQFFGNTPVFYPIHQ